jgi:Transglutaminase-like superfamily
VTELGRLAAPGRLPARTRLALGAEIVTTYARARRLLRRSDVREAVAALRGRAGSGEDRGRQEDYAAGLRLGRAVTRVLGPLPVDSRCLMSSLVLCGLLGRRGIGSSVVIGVRSGESFGAHSWVELGGRSVLPAPDEAGYERLVAL